jgi:hypothetical protein
MNRFNLIRNQMKYTILSFTFLFSISLLFSCQSSRKSSDLTPPEMLKYGADSTGYQIEILFERGKAHNHPLMVFWLEDENGRYLKTLYVARSIGKGIFSYGAQEKGAWLPGPIQRPASLPYWAHKRNIVNEFGNYIPSASRPVPDAVTGPTPARNFSLIAKTGLDVPERFVLKMEINQTWDFNEFWTNGKYPENDEYITSCQPALVYAVLINTKDQQKEYVMKPIGHSSFDGSDGNLNTDLSTITTAMDIAVQVKVIVK